MNLLTLTGRNLKVFFRDKTSVFFSLLAVFIVIGLYVLFLGDIMAKGLSHHGGDMRFLIDSWIMAGILSVTAVTTTMGAFGIMVEDRANNIIKDFSSSPIRRTTLAGGYILGAFIIGVIMSLVALVLFEVYIVAQGGALLGLAAMVKVIGIMLLSVLASSAMVFFIVSFFRSTNAFATASTIIGTLIGFLTGIYIPIGNLPEAVQAVIKVFPVSHSAALFRQAVMEAPMASVFANAPAAAQEQFSLSMGVVYRFGDTLTTAATSIWVLVATAAVFFALAALNMRRKLR